MSGKGVTSNGRDLPSEHAGVTACAHASHGWVSGLTATEPDAARQLAVIDALHACLEEGSIRYWLVGGWAVDFHAGRLTRPHIDVDITIWERDRTRLSRAVMPCGFRRRASAKPSEADRYSLAGVSVSVFFICRGHGGAVVNRGSYEHLPWPDGSFAAHRLQLLGHEATVVSLEGQRDAKLVIPPLLRRPRDQQDLVVLDAIANLDS
jgi:Aminoglycoside-2''-adenylyltransferase